MGDFGKSSNRKPVHSNKTTALAVVYHLRSAFHWKMELRLHTKSVQAEAESLSAFLSWIGSVRTNAACCDAVLEARVALLRRVTGPRAFAATHMGAAVGRAAREVQLDKL